MRKIVLIAILLLGVAALLLAQQAAPANEVAHGSEKAVSEAVHGTTPGEHDHEAQPKFLGLPSWLWKLANMLLFIGVLVYFIGGPVKKALAERSETIRKNAAQARERREKAANVASEIQARLTQVESEIETLKERAVREGERQRRELIAAAEAEAAKILATASSEVDNRLKRARQELTEFAGELASQRASELLRETITEEDQRKLFRDSLSEVKEARS